MAKQIDDETMENSLHSCKTLPFTEEEKEKAKKEYAGNA